uniref:Uncharacterized protein n=1 Tax=Anguilla anguilla TaxID=7936 RepID=A0A0E9W613_ANGAN
MLVFFLLHNFLNNHMHYIYGWKFTPGEKKKEKRKKIFRITSP